MRAHSLLVGQSKGQGEDSVRRCLKRVTSPDIDPDSTLILDFKLRNSKNMNLLFNSPNPCILLKQHNQTIFSVNNKVVCLNRRSSDYKLL